MIKPWSRRTALRKERLDAGLGAVAVGLALPTLQETEVIRAILCVQAPKVLELEVMRAVSWCTRSVLGGMTVGGRPAEV